MSMILHLPSPQVTGMEKAKKKFKEYLDIKKSVRSPVEWAEKYRNLVGLDSMWPGRFSFSRVPYMKEIAECFSPTSPVQEVAFKKGSQVMGTTCLTENIIGFYAHAYPCKILLVAHMANIIENNIKPRLLRMIEKSPLKSKLLSSKREKITLSDAEIVMHGATRPENFRNTSVRLLILEELTAYPTSIQREGSIKDLAKTRTKNYEQNRKILYISSALNNGDDMDKLFISGDQRYFYVPCPQCGHAQKLLFDFLRYEVDEAGKVAASSVFYECAKCQHSIKDSDKTAMFDAGNWVAEAPENHDEKMRSYHLSALYSPLGLQSWATICQQYEEAKKEAGNKMRVFFNTVLGENFTDEGVAQPTLQQVLANMMHNPLPYQRGCSPMPILYATIGVDVQQDRLEVEVVGWCEDKRNFSIDYFQMWGDPALLNDERGCWAQLKKLQDHIFEQGILSCTLIDAGNKGEQIYEFIQRYEPRMTWPIMGESPRSGNWPYRIRPVDGWGLQRLHINTPYFKRLFFEDVTQSLPQDKSLPPRYVGLPTDYDFKHQERLFFSERQEIVLVGGVKQIRWVQVKSENHPLDARVYAMAAAFRLREIICKDILDLDETITTEVEAWLKTEQGAKALSLKEFKG